MVINASELRNLMFIEKLSLFSLKGEYFAQGCSFHFSQCGLELAELTLADVVELPLILFGLNEKSKSV